FNFNCSLSSSDILDFSFCFCLLLLLLFLLLLLLLFCSSFGFAKRESELNDLLNFSSGDSPSHISIKEGIKSMSCASDLKSSFVSSSTNTSNRLLVIDFLKKKSMYDVRSLPSNVSNKG